MCGSLIVAYIHIHKISPNNLLIALTACLCTLSLSKIGSDSDTNYLSNHQMINIIVNMYYKGDLKCSFFAVAALVGAWLLSCCLLRQPASFTAQPTNEQFQDPL